ncbi:translin-associated protein X-like [Lineus longissimus]|uniref:translin-associated protein X-like n=1 Tax=Lineus longissimus TaxID=88925 RepID=UPI002B4F13A2
MADHGFKRKKREQLHEKKQESEEQPDVDENSPVIQSFRQYRKELDYKHDKYERLVKLSRDVTIESKRTIFLLQRLAGKEVNKAGILEDALKKLKEIQTDKFKKIAQELHGEEPFQYTRAYSPGMQEYIEAVSFYKYNRDETLVSMDEVQADLVFTETVKMQDMDVEEEDNQETAQDTITYTAFVAPMDYMLGIADLTGELMRSAINCVGNGDLDKPFQLCCFMRQIHDAFLSFGDMSRALPRKMNVLRQSLQKVETACYTLKVRGSEFPKHMLADIMRNLQAKQTFHSDELEYNNVDD